MTSDISGAAHVASWCLARTSLSITASFGVEVMEVDEAGRPARGPERAARRRARPARPRPVGAPHGMEGSWPREAFSCLTYKVMLDGERPAAKGVRGCCLGPNAFRSFALFKLSQEWEPYSTLARRGHVSRGWNQSIPQWDKAEVWYESHNYRMEISKEALFPFFMKDFNVKAWIGDRGIELGLEWPPKLVDRPSSCIVVKWPKMQILHPRVPLQIDWCYRHQGQR